MAKTRESSSPTTEKPRAAKNQLTQEEIALRAYQIYQERGATPGNEFEDWIEAERQLLGVSAKATENGKVAENGNGNGKARRKPKVNSAAA